MDAAMATSRLNGKLMNPLLRYISTIVVTGLTAAYSYYPHYQWIPVVLAVAANLGIHVVPAISAHSPVPQTPSTEDPSQS